MKQRYLIIFGLLVSVLLLGNSPLWAASNTVTDIFIVEDKAKTKLVFNLKSKAKFDAFRLANPNRIVVDLNQTALNSKIPSFGTTHLAVKQMRTAERKNHARRFVIDTYGKLNYKTYRLKPNKKYGHRLVLELEHDSAVVSSRQAKPTPVVKTASLPVTSFSKERQRDIVIAIDAGHGGQDPGAIGKHGTREKDVVLKIAKKLKAVIDRQPGMRGVLVRNNDHYITLRGRINIARKANADMFVSIHADAYTNRRVKGSSVYVLSERGASDEAAKWLADKENAADLIGGVTINDKEDVLARVLLDLSQTATIESSSIVAESVLSEIRKVAPVHKKSVQHARFVVLKSPDIPSILVETAFISNPSEERRLNQARYQDKLARAMLKGIKAYFIENPLPGTLLAQTQKPVRVQPGDTLSALAESYNVSVAQLKRHNQLKSDRLMIGQTLYLPF